MQKRKTLMKTCMSNMCIASQMLLALKKGEMRSQEEEGDERSETMDLNEKKSLIYLDVVNHKISCMFKGTYIGHLNFSSMTTFTVEVVFVDFHGSTN